MEWLATSLILTVYVKSNIYRAFIIPPQPLSRVRPFSLPFDVYQ